MSLMTGADEIEKVGVCVADAVLLQSRPVPREKKSTEGPASAFFDTAGADSVMPCDTFGGSAGNWFDTACGNGTGVLEDGVEAVGTGGFLVAGLSPSIALNASLLLPFGLLLAVGADSMSSGAKSYCRSSLIRSGASVMVGVSESSIALAAFLASASFFLSARISSSLRLGAGSMPKSECFEEDALLKPSLGFLLSVLDPSASSDSAASSLPLADCSESTLITLRLVTEDTGGGKDSLLLFVELDALAVDEGGGSFDASPDLGGGRNELSFEEDGLLAVSGVVFATA